MRKSKLIKSLLDQTAPVEAWDWRWTVLPPWRKLLEGDRAVPWLALADCADAELLKDNDLRSVWRMQIDKQTVIAKVYQPVAGWGRLKTLAFGPAARNEFMAGLYAQHKNLPTVRPIAWGKPMPGSTIGPHVLLTELIPEAKSLSTAWLELAGADGHRSRSACDPFIARTARFLEQLHQGGFSPTDLHPDNVLIALAQEPTLVDLYNARWYVRTHEVLRILNLADLNQWFQRQASRSDRLRLLLAYLTCAFEQPSPRLIRKYVSEVEEVSGWKTEKLEKKRDRRIFGDNKYFGVVTLPDDWTAYVYLQAKRPLAGSPCSRLEFAKLDWAGALTQMLDSDSPAGHTLLRLGAHDVNVTVEDTAKASSNLRDRWQRDHKKINRHEAVPLPLALLERRRGKDGGSILVVERSKQNEREHQPH